MAKTNSNQPDNFQMAFQQLRNILDCAGDAFVLHDLDGKIIDVNKTLCDGLGFSRDELLAKNVGEIDLEEEAVNRALWRKTLNDGVTRIIHRNHRCKDGLVRKVEVKIQSLGSGSENYILSYVRDITQKVNIEEELKFTRFAIDHAAEAAFWMQANDSKFIYVNNKACEYLGYSKSELLTMSVPDINPKFTLDGWPEFVDRVIEASELVFESDHLRKDGSFVPVEVKAGHMQYKDQNYVVSFVRDITARRQANNLLNEAKLKAEQANQAKSDFLTSMSHELKTPLNAIIGYSDMLVDEADNEKLSEDHRHFSQSINQAGHHLLGLIEEILDLAQIEAGRARLDIRSVPVQPVLEECIGLVALSAKNQNISLESNIEKFCDYKVDADKMKFKQVMLNLLSNAIKYNKHEGSVVVQFEQEQDMLKINVIDTGIGIPEEKRADVFSAFSRLGRESSEIEGSGVGLLVSKKLTELMGGQMSYSSQTNQGSCFWFTLPLEKTALS